MKSFISNLQFVIQPISNGNKDFLDEEEKFQEKLLQLSENVFSNNANDAPPPVQLLQQLSIKDCVVGPEHIAFLFDDGRVCRLGYTASVLSPQSQKQADDPLKDKSYHSRAGRNSKSMRTDDSPWNLNNASLLNMGGSSSTTAASSARKTARMSLNAATGMAGSNIRLIRSGQVRSRNLPLLSGQRPVLPASLVPEDLINQVQGVLQGKSRSVIVRELQRTNLDVNLAVNNLLSRDDEDNDDLDDAGDYIPGEELMSLLDGGMHPGDHPRVVIDADAMLPEDLLGYSFSGRPPPASRGVGGANNDRQNDPDDDNLGRINSPHWIDLFRRIDAKRQPKVQAGSMQKLPPPGSSGISLTEEVQWWVNESGEQVRFKLIGGMHSELVAVDNCGNLRQWKWRFEKPYHDKLFHPRTAFLNLQNQKISMLASCSLRSSVVTESGCVATWMDESIPSHTMSLDQPSSAFDFLQAEEFKSIHVCSLYSAVLTKQGRVYWWGVLPFNQRKKILEKSQNSLLHSMCKENAPITKQELRVGSHVCLRHFPIYHGGAIAVNISTGTPKMGKLLESVWSLEKKARFQIINQKVEPEKEQSSATTEDAAAITSASLADASKSQKRKRSTDEDAGDQGEDEVDEEEWDLQKVVFIEDVRSVPIGTVTKIDGNIVAVQFSNGSDKSGEELTVSASILSSCRLLHKDDIVVVTSSAPRVLDCVQKVPKKLQCDPRLYLHCINATTTGVAAVGNKPGEKLSYLQLSISQGKITTQKALPTKVESFLGDSSKEPSTSRTEVPPKCKLINCSQECPTLLQDYNAMLYPLLADENDGIRDPIWADIPPLLASGMGIHSADSDTRYTVTVLAFQHQVLMPLVLRRDFPAFEGLVKSMESSKASPWMNVFYKSLLDERCDGQRNLLHMCIEMSIPSSNKEQKEDEKEKESKRSPAQKNVPESPSRAGEPKPLLPSASSVGGLFMTDSDHADAVSAIANAISAVTRGQVPLPGASAQSESSLSRSSNATGSAPPNPPDPYSGGPWAVSLSEVPPRETPVLTWPPDLPAWRNPADAQQDEEGINLTVSSSDKKKAQSTAGVSDSKNEGKDRGTRLDAVAMLKLICNSKCTQPYLKKLLTQKDTAGYTPFMFAVAHRAYPAALILFSTAMNIAKESPQDKGSSGTDQLSPEQYKELFSMIYPEGSNADDNPLYMLCCNDTCSFTWTGDQHINQGIFECLTCGLAENLCCCTECARVCHKGHDCKLKLTSPTAYCDCWEKCACKSLVAGDNADRMSLLRNLLHLTDLHEIHNSSGQHILHFLIQTVARQMEEQRQWRPPPRTTRMNVPPPRSHRMGRSGAKSPTQSGDQDMPEHDLHPPRFCREALLQLLSDWKAVRSLVMGGAKGRRDKLSMSFRLDSKEQGGGSSVPLLPEDEELMQQQSGTARLDMFTHTILIKSASYEYLDKLLETLIHAVQLNKGLARDEGIMVARRFLRSVIRVFIVLTAQSTPDKITSKSSFYNQPTAKCRRAFLALTPIAVEELCEMAESLIAPVRMGVTRPTTSYSLLSSNIEVFHGSTHAFSKMPFPPRSSASDDEDNSGKPGSSGVGASKQTKKSAKSRKKSKRNILSRRYGSGRARSRRSHVREPENDEDNGGNDSDHMETSQETSSTAVVQEAGDDDQGGDSERNESDLDLTDIELLAESESDSMGSEDSKNFRDYWATCAPSQDQEDDDDDDEEYDTEPVNEDQGEVKTHQGEDEDTDSDHLPLWHDEHSLERQATRQLRTESRQAPHAMQWAMGTSSMIPVKPPRSGGGSGGSRVASGNMASSSNSGSIYVDRVMRRSDNLENAYINSILDRHYGSSRVKHVDETRVNSSSVTNAQLARLFATCIREVSHLLAILKKGDYLHEAPLSTVFEVSFKDSSDLQAFVKSFLEKTWSWLLRVVESTEYQLRYGQVLLMASSPTHKDHPRHKATATRDNRRSRDTSRNSGGTSLNEDSSARQDFLSYALSLMRSHSNEHSDLLPIVDVAALKHVAYVLDAYIYYMRGLSFRDSDDAKNNSRNQLSLDIGYDNSENEDEEEDDFSFQDDLYSVAIQSDPVSLRLNTNVASDEELNLFSQPPTSFFRRSDSMTFLGCSDPNPFEVPLTMALPLAEKPHILQPSARKEELFGRPRTSASQHSHQVSSMSLCKRSVQESVRNRKEEEAASSSSSSRGTELAAKSNPSDHSHPPPPYSSVIRSTSSLNPLQQKMSDDAGKDVAANAEPVAMESIPAPGAAVTVDVASSEIEPGTSGKQGNDGDVAESVLGKCRLTLELFSRVFLDDVGNEPKSILQELGGFEVREAKFRKDMERIRTSQTVDLQLNVERSRDPLIQQTFKNLNQHFKRRCGSSQPMAVLRVKVLFKDEPGEGTGVARSFYTAISEALLSSDPLPSLDGLIPGSSNRKPSSSSSVHPLMAQLCKRSQDREERGRSARYRDRGTRRGFTSGASVTPMATNAAPYYRRSSAQRGNQSSIERSKQAIGARLFPKVLSMHSTWAPKITGMLLGLPAYELLLLLRSERTLQERVSEAIDQLLTSGYRAATGQRQSPSGGETRHEDGEASGVTGESRNEAPGESAKEKPGKASEKESSSGGHHSEDPSGGPPLFYQPGKRGFYAPTSWGEMTEARLNAFRNVGRILGLCLLQNELCPLPLCRHVLKVILGRKVNWHDLAFFDPTLYESLRQLVLDAESDDGGVLEDLELTFVADLQSEESGRQVSLIPDGAMTPVTKSNVRDYVRRYALHRMVVCCKRPLEKIRQGVLDVLPRFTLQSLTAEDLRLLVNGCGHVDLRTLISYTMFNDESGKSGSAEKLVQFKRWFWAVVDRLSASDKQELLYFWTGSPALPASEDGFQPMPTITIRPPDDQHLPTANTCISRLYVPLYSSRQILKQKLSVAIKTKNFGFV